MAGEANMHATDWDFEFGGVGSVRLGGRAGAELLGATAYELAPGSRWADLHYHHANEEMILVLSGRPTIRTLDGERELETGDVVVCLRGKPGAHCLENRTDEPARVVIVSTTLMPEVVEYPEREDAFVMTEPPYTDRPEPEQGRLLRVFRRADGRPVPPDA